jgi:hypothetical protein
MNPIFKAWNKGVSRSGSGGEVSSFAIRVASFWAQARHVAPGNTPHFSPG